MKRFFAVLFYVLGLMTAEDAVTAAPSAEAREKVTPYLLPQDHPARPTLDRIFSSSRVLLSLKSMKKAGFEDPQPRKFTHLIVTRHPKLKGYVIKAYLDAQRYPKNKPEHYFWLLRIKGAEMIRSLVEAHGWQNWFKVPKKWIYALPANPPPPADYPSKNYILIEEDMRLHSHDTNLKKWKGANADLLDKVYVILEALGLHDCAKPDNLPFTKYGGLAFIDTQTFEDWPVAYEKLNSFLSSDMRTYWKKLTDQ